ARKPKPHADAFDPARNARAALISGDQPASSELRNEPLQRILECAAFAGRSFDPVEVVQRHRAVSGRAHVVETVPQGLQRLVEALAANQRAVQTELPGNVREESELRSVHPARAQTLD